MSKFPLHLVPSRRALTTGRFIVAATHLFTPRLAARVFQLTASGTPAIPYARMFAIRNAALGLGLQRMDSFTRSQQQQFLAVNIVMDSVDAAAFLAAGLRRDVSRTSAMLSAAVALSAVVAGTTALIEHKQAAAQETEPTTTAPSNSDWK
ncbi:MULTISPECIES: hypothetical protein [unclassified Streptomyces]|uniref:hypothetical protein n=1 Tax=unclassified Streptomyces TaxID=2593676 RepID=UPI002E78C3B3|nr:MULTISPECIES: hypothetical protein [unclassified Streptomyces]MEE1759335.1 hypothetical protein [Streptomyces sp. SP18BB07]MEE1831731.1 hypothetical protein [Streptomyces sp. SP17KL33]